MTKRVRMLFLLASGFFWQRSELPAQSLETIVNFGSAGWNYLHPVDGSNNGFDPATVDPDFNSTWFDPAGTYNLGPIYDGPAFTTLAQAPFQYGGVNGLTPNTTLAPTPNPGTRGSAYFLLAVDGGAVGYHSLELDMLCDDGAFVYLNGELVADDGMPGGGSDTWGSFASSAANESTYDSISWNGFPFLNPGPNLLAISVHQVNATSSDLGFDLVLRGIPGPPPLLITRGPYLQSGTPNDVTIRWSTNDPASSTVRYGSAPGSLTNTLTVPGSETKHIVPLAGLSPNTQYFYEIESVRTSDSEVVSAGAEPDYYFITAPVAGAAQPVRIWAIGDSGTGGNGSGQAESVYSAYRAFTGSGSIHTDVWLMLGDNAYNAGTVDEYQKAVFDTYPEMLRNTLLWPTIGNHDATNAATYLDIFALPTAGEAGGLASGTELYYSFDYADVHFVCLDSQTSGNYNAAVGTGMYAWLESDLMATTQSWIIAYYHHGPYTKGSHDSDTESHHLQTRAKATTLLEDYGVDLVLYGHSHCYERSMLINGHYGLSGTFDPETMAKDSGNGSEVGGVDAVGDFVPGAGDGAYVKPYATANEGAVYITAGSSGKLSNWHNGSSVVVNPEPHSVMTVNLRVLGSMVLDVAPDQLHAQFLDDSGNIRDDFTIMKAATVLSISATDDEAAEFGGDATADFEVTRKGESASPLTAGYLVGGSASSPGDYTPTLNGMVDFSAGQVSKTITIARVQDSLVEGPETAELSLLPGGGYLLGASDSAVVTIQDKPSDAWRFGFFGGESPVGSGWFEDFDGDGVLTLLEYGLGGDPTVAELGLLPAMMSDGSVLKLIYQRDHSLSDLIYRVTTGSGLVDWSETGVTDTVSGPANPLGIETREATTPIAPGSGFLRLELELLP